jgi:urea transport system substrate-binding protein
LINKVKLKRPGLIYTAVVGGSNVAWYKQLKAAGVTSKKYNLLTISTTEDELLGIGGENAEGFYSCMKYFQSQKNPSNLAFVEAFKKKWGADSVIGDVTQAAYLGPWLWKKAVEKAGSFDIDKIHAAHSGIEFPNAPEGYVRIHDTNQHLWSKAKIGKVLKNGQFEVIAVSDELIEPDPFPKGYQ